MPKAQTERAQSSRETNDQDARFGRRMRARRLELGMSQEKLAAILGVTFQQVQKYEKGVNRIAASRLSDIADALECSVLLFFDKDDAKGVKASETANLLTMPHMIELMHKLAGLPPATRKKVSAILDAMKG